MQFFFRQTTVDLYINYVSSEEYERTGRYLLISALPTLFWEH